jgi:transcriptional regulator with GAF, ATPase, and Fis domain/tetratricopeptide (TPR) repeat protein
LAETILTKFESTLEEGRDKSLMMAHVYKVTGIEPPGPELILSAAQYLLSEQRREEASVYFRLVLDYLAERKQAKQQPHSFIDAVLGIISSQGHLMPLEEQGSYLDRAWKTARRLQDIPKMCELGTLYGRVSEQTGNYRKASRLFQESWRVAQQSGDATQIKRTALMTTDFLFRRGRVGDAVERYEQAIGNLEEFPSDKATLRACSILGWCYSITGQTARAIGLIEAVHKRAEEAGFLEIAVFSDVMAVLALLEARLLAEAKVVVDRILDLPESFLGYFVLWATYHAKAYLLYVEGELNECFKFQQKAHDCSIKYGWPHHRGPWIFEYLNGLEQAGLIHPKMTYQSELERIMAWPDIFMKGVALRFQAQRALDNSKPLDEILEDLKKSRTLLTRAGARLELAQTHLLMARVLLHLKKKRAESLLQQAWKTMSHVNPELFPEDLKSSVTEGDPKERLIKIFLETSNVLSTVRDKETLLERIINLTTRLTIAQRGAVFLRGEASKLELAASRNLDNTTVKSESFRDHMSLVDQAAAARREICEAESTAGGDLDNCRYAEQGWTICIPLVLGDRLFGILYLNGRLNPRKSLRDDLLLFKAIGNQVAIALDNVQAYEEVAALKNRLEEETRFYRTGGEISPLLPQMIGGSNTILRVHEDIQKVAQTDASVLLTGETGVGKELVARGVHQLSNRSTGPFIAVNIASLSEGVVTSELFGHEKGAFTGALRARAGRFELAHGGTLFLDDIQNLSDEIQVKLLRVLQEKEFTRVGSSMAIKADFRLIAATNKSLPEMIVEGEFRSDLYYRLNVFPIHVPPLRDRRDDIPALSTHFMEVFAKRFGKEVKKISKPDMRRLVAYPWPGNVRELKHVVERGVILSEGEFLTVPQMSTIDRKSEDPKRYKSLDEVQRSFLIGILEECGWKVSGPGGAAELINMKPTTLYSKMKKLGIQRGKAQQDRSE